MMNNTDSFRIGELARRADVTVRTVRYYESLGLLKRRPRRKNQQRVFDEKDLIYIQRIKQLKRLGLTLEEIGDIIRMGQEDTSGEKRRLELIKQYREKLSIAIKHRKDIEALIGELSWHLQQLEEVTDFQACPGEACAACAYTEICEFKEFRPPGTAPTG